MSEMQRLDILPFHVRDRLLKEPMFLQRKHNEEVAFFRLVTGADVWKGRAALQEKEAEE